MMNKTEVSNLITGLRPKVRQSGIHLVHLLTREIKKLENRKGDKAEKFKKKAETFRKEALLVKKIEPDDVSRYAVMMNFGERQKLLNDVSLPLETKVIVKMATHKNVVAHIENFRKVHAEWKDKLPDLLKNLGIFTQFKKKVEKQQAKSKRKLDRKQALAEDSVARSSVMSTIVETEKKSKIVPKNITEKVIKKTPSFKKEASTKSGNNLEIKDESSNAESDNIEDESDHFDAESDQSDAEIEQSDAESEQSGAGSGNSEAECDQSDNESDQAVDQSDAESDFEVPNYIVPKSQGQNKAPVKPKGPRISSASLFAEVRRFADLEQEKNLEKERKSNCDSSSLPNEDLSDNEAVEEDTFFMTGENKFLKTVAVKREDGEGLQTSDRSAEKKSLSLWVLDKDRQTGNRAERRAQMRGDFSKKKFRETSFKDFNKSHHKSENDNKKNKKQFDSNSHNRRNVKEFSKFNKKDFGNNKTSNQQEQSNADKSLHPSWEAKRRQKVSLDCFQGKKMKFDD